MRAAPTNRHQPLTTLHPPSRCRATADKPATDHRSPACYSPVVAERWERALARWTNAGLIDQAAADRIRRYEAERPDAGRLHWPVLLAAGFGALMAGAGVLLFVASHWDTLSPAVRFVIVLGAVGVFHVSGALASPRTPVLATALHAAGTAALGGGIYLSGQIFNMAEHWPAGVLLWAVGAWLAWLVLRHEIQLVFAAALTPAWYTSEWMVALARAGVRNWDEDIVTAAAIVLVALALFTAPSAPDHRRGGLVWLGAAALAPSLAFLALTTASPERMASWPPRIVILALAIVVGAPLAAAWLLRRSAAWLNVVALAWVVMLLPLSRFREALILFGWWAIGSLGLAAWGVLERRVERINAGALLFAIVVLAFYFSSVMDKLGRSASLLGLGLLFLAGGWALERTRRTLIRTAREGA